MLIARERMRRWGVRIGGAVLLIAALATVSASDQLFQVGSTPSTTELSSSANPSVVGEVVRYVAKVSDDPEDGDAGLGVPTGTVDFVEGDTTICEDVALSSTGRARCRVPYRATGRHTIVAVYSGDANFAESTSPELIQQVNRALTSTRLSSSDGDNKTVSGQSVTYTARVSVRAPGSGTPGGTVKFKDGDTTVSGCGARTLSSGAATCVTNLRVGSGTHAVTATYAGNSKYRTSASDPITQTVSQASTKVGLVSSKSSAFSISKVTYTATVTVAVPGTGPAGGKVVFKDGGTPISACSGSSGQPLSSSGVARCTVQNARVGTHTITARYQGTSNFKPSTSNSIRQVFRYRLRAFISSGSLSDPLQGSFRISGNPPTPYRLCVKYDDPWPAKTPPPADGKTRYTLNLHLKCKNVSWKSGLGSTRKMGADYGFATKGTYLAVWYVNGNQIGKNTMKWNSWCPPGPTSLRQLGVWRPARLKVLDSCKTATGTVAKWASISNLDQDKGWRWSSNIGTLHVEYVARDRLTSYGAPSEGALGVHSPDKKGTTWTLTGVYVCDTFHGWKEFHAVFRGTRPNGATWISGPQYSTKAPSVSGTWSAHAC